MKLNRVLLERTFKLAEMLFEGSVAEVKSDGITRTDVELAQDALSNAMSALWNCCLREHTVDESEYFDKLEEAIAETLAVHFTRPGGPLTRQAGIDALAARVTRIIEERAHSQPSLSLQ
jgi:hypothetical protein